MKLLLFSGYRRARVWCQFRSSFRIRLLPPRLWIWVLRLRPLWIADEFTNEFDTLNWALPQFPCTFDRPKYPKTWNDINVLLFKGKWLLPRAMCSLSSPIHPVSS